MIMNLQNRRTPAPF